MDKEILRMARVASEKCKEILLEKKTLVENLAERLLEKETLDLKDIVSVLGERPFEPRDNFKAYLEAKEKDDTEKVEETKE